MEYKIVALNFDNLARCIRTLEQSLKHLEASPENSIEYEMFRNSVVKSFELTLETTGKILRKVLREYVGDPKTINVLTFKDVLRHAAKHHLLKIDELERWFAYRDSRNDTAHDYGEHFATQVLEMIQDFFRDATRLHQRLVKLHGPRS